MKRGGDRDNWQKRYLRIVGTSVNYYKDKKERTVHQLASAVCYRDNETSPIYVHTYLYAYLLYTFTRTQDAEPRGSINLLGAVVQDAAEKMGKKLCVEIRTPERSYYFYTETRCMCCVL